MRRSYPIVPIGIAVLLAAVSGACAPKPIVLPSGAGAPFPGAADALAAATAGCRDVRSASAELGLSGRVGATKLRGRAIVGVAAPDRIRLEALAPFGPPVFILAARDGRATLLLPRDDRVLRDEPVEAIVEALAGIRLDPASLRAALAGCGVEPSRAAAGRSYGDGWAAIDLDGGRTVFLHRDRAGGEWVVRGAETPALTITYDEMAGPRPARITIRSRASAVTAEVRLRVSQLDINPVLADEAFTLDVPAGAAPLTLDELRAAGPLGDRRP